RLRLLDSRQIAEAFSLLRELCAASIVTTRSPLARAYNLAPLQSVSLSRQSPNRFSRRRTGRIILYCPSEFRKPVFHSWNTFPLRPRHAAGSQLGGSSDCIAWTAISHARCPGSGECNSFEPSHVSYL